MNAIKKRYSKWFVVLCCANLMLFQSMSRSQSKESISSLKVGDFIPEKLWDRSLSVANHPEGIDTITLNQYKDKLIILDFWSTWCQSCVKLFPKLQALENEFSEEIKVLLATPEEANVINPFLDKMNTNLLSIVNGKFLSSYFPHRFVPHEVWIKDGKVFAVTSHLAVTKENIQGVLSGKFLSLPEMKTDYTFDNTKPLLLDGNGGGSDDVLYRFVMTGYIDGISPGGVNTDDLGRFRVRANNGSVQDLYRLLFYRTNKALAYNNRNILEFNTEAILPPPDLPRYAIGAREKCYGYELIVPESLKDATTDIILEELNRYFGSVLNIKAVVEKRKVKCWVLIKKDYKEKCLSKINILKNLEVDQEEILSYTKIPFKDFYEGLRSICKKEPYPLIDETGITENIDITIPYNIKDIEEIKPYLQKYGLDIKQKERKIEMLVIKDISK